MPSTPSGVVTQNNLTGSQLLYSDTGSYGAVTSRILTIFDCNGILLDTINMGGNLTATYDITADGFYQFICTVADNVGGSPWITVKDYVAIGFYTASYLNYFNATRCGCTGIQCNMEIAENFYNAALRFNVASNFVAANANIIGANVYINLQQ